MVIGVPVLEKTTHEAVDVLVSELLQRNDRIRSLELEDVFNEEQSAAEKQAKEDYRHNRSEMYEGQGTGLDVPKYLRFSGSIRKDFHHLSIATSTPDSTRSCRIRLIIPTDVFVLFFKGRRAFTKRQVEVLVHEIWDQKRTYDKYGRIGNHHDE